MAGTGRAVGRLEAALGIIGVLALATTYALITGWNPVPGFLEWVQRNGSLAKPEATWVDRVGDQPTAAVIADRAVVITMRGAIEARDLRDGTVLWQREADWAAVAGDDSGAVAVVGSRGSGLEAIEPSTGKVRWKDGEAVGAWTYRESVLTLSCGGLTDCTLAYRSPADGATRWKSTLPGIGRVHAGVNSDLLGSREMSSTFRDALAASPGPIPAMLGFPIDQRVQVVDTASGKRLRQENPTGTTRVVVVGGRVLISSAVPRDGNCRYTLEGRDAGSGRTIWKKEGYDLRIASGVGCEQRRDPAGGGGVLAATRGDNREVFLSARDGRELWVGAQGEKIVATDGRYALIRGPDGRTVRCVDLTTGTKSWEQPAGRDAQFAITRWAVLAADLSDGTLRAFDPVSGRLVVDVKTTADVLGYGPTGLIIGRGRTIGFLPYGSLL